MSIKRLIISLKQWSVLLLANSLIFLILFEGLSHLFFKKILANKSSSIGRKFRVQRHLSYDTTSDQKGGLKGKTPHPFFGYIKNDNSFEKISIIHRSNNNSRFRVGIFGGSVAEDVYHTNERHRLIEKMLSKELKIKQENIEIINFSLGGYRQPQAHNIAAIYGHSVDLAFNIEGSNEMTYVHKSRFPHYYPLLTISNTYYRGFENLKRIGEMIQIAQAKGAVSRRLYKDEYILNLFKVFDLLLYSSYGKKLDLIQDRIAKTKQHNFFDLEDSKVSFTLNENFTSWLKLSCLQQNILYYEDSLNLFFIQPVPYISKSLTEKERSLQNSEHQHFHRQIKKLFEKVDLSKVQRSGLNLISLMDAFENSNDEIYVDHCCHMNEEGNLKILSLITKNLRSKLATQPKLCNLKELKKYLTGIEDLPI